MLTIGCDPWPVIPRTVSGHRIAAPGAANGVSDGWPGHVVGCQCRTCAVCRVLWRKQLSVSTLRQLHVPASDSLHTGQCFENHRYGGSAVPAVTGPVTRPRCIRPDSRSETCANSRYITVYGVNIGNIGPTSAGHFAKILKSFVAHLPNIVSADISFIIKYPCHIQHEWC